VCDATDEYGERNVDVETGTQRGERRVRARENVPDYRSLRASLPPPEVPTLIPPVLLSWSGCVVLCYEMGVCRKCQGDEGERRVVVWTADGGRCRVCFVDSVFAAVRVAVGRAAMLPPSRYGFGGDEARGILIAVSGGLSSMAMLYLLRPMLFARTDPSRRRCPVVVAHICARNGPSDNGERHLLELEKFAHTLGFDQVVLSRGVVRHRAQQDQSDDEFMQEEWILDSLVEVANQCHCERVFLGSNATRLASNLVTALVTGRGNAVPVSISSTFCRSNVTFFRPMKDLTGRQLCRFAVIQDIMPYVVVDPHTILSGQRTLGSMSTEFVLRLQDDKSSTISTLLRTAEKVGVRAGPGSPQCMFCDELIAPQSIAPEMSSTLLCYACSALMRRSGFYHDHPSQLLSTDDARERMQAEIEEFLLPDD